MLPSRYPHTETMLRSAREHALPTLAAGPLPRWPGLRTALHDHRVQRMTLIGLLLLVCAVSLVHFVSESPDPIDLAANSAISVPSALQPEAPVTNAILATHPRVHIRQIPAAHLTPAPVSSSGVPPTPKALNSAAASACTPAGRAFINGEELAPVPASVGHGRVLIINGTNSDAVVKLAPRSPNETSRRVYVAAGQQVNVGQINAGDYRLMFTLGTGWSLDQHKFCTSPEYSEFAKDLHFQEKHIYEQIEYDQAQVTLNGVVGGNIPVRKLSEQEFLAN